MAYRATCCCRCPLCEQLNGAHAQAQAWVSLQAKLLLQIRTLKVVLTC